MLRRVICACVVLAVASDPATAQLRADKPVVDLGEMRSGPRLTQTFLLRNDGPDAIDILELRPSCGCALARVDAHFLKPRDQATVTVEINTLGQAGGAHAWKTLVHARQGEKAEELALEVRAQLITELTVEPAALTLFTEGTRSHEIVLTDRRPKPLTVTTVRSSLLGLRAEVINQQQGVVRIRVEVSPDLPSGRHEALVSLYSNDPFYRDLHVPVRIIKQSRSAVSFGPRQLDFGAARGQSFAAKLVRLWSAQDVAIEIGRIYADDAAVACTWAAGPGNQATVKICVDHTRLTSNQLQSAVHVDVRRPVVETITIPVTVEIK
jgi:hypothetical protein